MAHEAIAIEFLPPDNVVNKQWGGHDKQNWIGGMGPTDEFPWKVLQKSESVSRRLSRILASSGGLCVRILIKKWLT